MTTRMVDRNGMRGGAGISAVVLAVSAVFDWQGAVPVMAAALGIGAIFGLRYSPLGATYRSIKKAFKLQIPVEPEEEPPPRFAQLLGFVVLSLASLGFYALNSAVAGWTCALIVLALQTLLAVTGLCVGCEIYLYGKRLSARGTA
jgi:Domain of unknown function (DUF4395)